MKTKTQTQKVRERAIKEMRAKGKFGVYLGRFCPMHVGHQAMIETLLEAFGNNHLVMIGSCNEEISIRHLFNYSDRSEFIRAVYPSARIAPLPDFGNNEMWFNALDDIIRLAGADPSEVVFIGGSEEDIEFYFHHHRQAVVINRYAGSLTVDISASRLRDDLIHGRETGKNLDPRIKPLVIDRFKMRWQEVSSH